MGEDNHWLFLQLCFYTQVLSLFTLVLDFCQYYYFHPLTGLDQVRSAADVLDLRVFGARGVDYPRFFLLFSSSRRSSRPATSWLCCECRRSRV